MTPIRLAIIGSGNVASALAPAFAASPDVDLIAICSPTPGHAEALASTLSPRPEAVESVASLPRDADVYLIAVKDDRVASVALEAAGLFPATALWLHTSGSVPAEALARAGGGYGVLYPLQTFSKGVPVNLRELPVFIEANTAAGLDTARRLAEAISPIIHEADSELRKRMHVAAVFACNFTNYFWTVADDILRHEPGLNLSVLHPLLKETLRKAMAEGPEGSQTGPARRGDRGVIEAHKELLGSTDEARLYGEISEAIIRRYNSDKPNQSDNSDK